MDQYNKELQAVSFYPILCQLRLIGFLRPRKRHFPRRTMTCNPVMFYVRYDCALHKVVAYNSLLRQIFFSDTCFFLLFADNNP